MVNDYWDYLSHGLFGKEWKSHKYYMRVADGTNKNGRPKYLYFYSKAAYDAYRNTTKPKPTRAQQKEWDKTRQLAGWKRLTGAYRLEHHPNGRTVHIATEQYVDRDGQTKLRKKYISAEEADRLRDAKYRKQRAENETADEKKTRMKDAKKRYKKKTSAARRKRAAQKGAQTVARLLGKQLTFRKNSGDKNTEKAAAKAKWSNLFGNVYLRRKPKK